MHALYAIRQFFGTLLYRGVFYIVVTPVGSAARLFGYDPLRSRSWRTTASLLQDRQHTFTAQDFEESF